MVFDVLTMKRVTSIIYLLSLITAIHGLSPRIFRGTDASEGKYRYHAYLSAKVKSEDQCSSVIYCGGSIIDKRWILTAAHCFKNIDFRYIEVKVGTILRSGKTGTIYRVEKRVVHEGYNAAAHFHDIALLRLDKDIAFNDKVQPIKLANINTRVNDNEYAIMTGFGRIENHKCPEVLQTALLKMYSHRTCKGIKPKIDELQFCTLPKSTEGKGPCVGDSGGPLVNQNGIQVGVYSHSYGSMPYSCGESPDIYTKVSKYRDWIDQKIRQYCLMQY